MLKRALTLLLALAMVTALATVGMAKTTDVDYQVDSFWGKGFLKDDDGYINLESPSQYNTVTYGETIYFPLLNTAYTNHNTADKDRTAAYDAWQQAITDAATAKTDYETAKKNADDAKTAYDAAVNAKAITDAYEAAIGAATTYESKVEAEASPKSTYETAQGTTATKKSAYEGALSTLNGKLAEGATAYTTSTTEAELETAKNALDENATEDLKSAYNAAITAAGDYEDAVKAESEAKSAWDTATGATAAALTEYKGKLNKLNELITNDYNTENVPTAATLTAAKPTTTYTDSEIANLKSTYDTAASTASTKKGLWDTAEQTVKDKKAAYDATQTAVDKTYAFVYESDAVTKVSVSASWSLGKKYVDSVDIVRVKATSPNKTYSLGSTSSMAKIYCVAVTLKENTSTKEADVGGTIKLGGKSNGEKVSYEDSVDLTIAYASASSSTDGEIPVKAITFEEGYGFDADDEFIFTFEDDEDSYFVVNTNSQKAIVLAFDRDYDDKIGDKIAKKNPNADLDFYNGNYARFSKTGTLYLGYDTSKAYVYAISSSGSLSRVSDAEYDSSEDAFAIRTNTLGRYLISTEKLKSISSDDEDESSSSSKVSASTTTKTSGTGTTTSKTTSTKTSTTQSVASKPVSSTPASSKPASSSSVPASSAPSSSSETEASSESISEESESSSEYEEVVIDTDETEDDVPTKEGGISWLVWVLIFAGLAAVLIAVGVIFYTHRNSGSRML